SSPACDNGNRNCPEVSRDGRPHIFVCRCRIPMHTGPALRRDYDSPWECHQEGSERRTRHWQNFHVPAARMPPARLDRAINSTSWSRSRGLKSSDYSFDTGRGCRLPPTVLHRAVYLDPPDRPPLLHRFFELPLTPADTCC